jgi:hypothetical protein
MGHYEASYADWKRKLDEYGFDVTHARGYCWFPFRRDSNSSLVPIFTRVERMLGLSRLPALSPWVVFVAQKR